ncbi:DUF397 domain-containing protein [Kitasatospora sp. NPDC101155]|uniref:DUF397 domain-containing protein n=1 Tax=Kitasatospora sp. NPDC101155 TaxID=3364097 RepID=UPI00382C4454
MAARLGWHQSKVSRLENGRHGVKANEVGILLDVYEVTDPETREALATLAREGKRRVWWQPYSDVISQRYASFISFEAEAVSIRNADGFAGIVPVRDSKDPSGPALVFPAEAWTAFVTAIKAGNIPNA